MLNEGDLREVQKQMTFYILHMRGCATGNNDIVFAGWIFVCRKGHL